MDDDDPSPQHAEPETDQPDTDLPTVVTHRAQPLHRESSRTYFIRRLVALLLLGAFVCLAASVGNALIGGEGNATLGTATTNLGSVPTGTAGLPTSPPTVDTDVPLISSTDDNRVPTSSDPARLYIAGDSDADAFASFLEGLVAKTGVVTSKLDSKTSSGLARPDFFDWPARFARKIPALNPDIVVVTFGGNDAQPIHGLNKQVDTPEWRAEYAKRVAAVMDLLSADGRTLIWVGIPNDDTADNTARLAVQDGVVREQVAAHPGVVFIDTWKIFSGIDGGYAAYAVDPRDGVSKRVRQSIDGFHLNTTGAEILALYIATAIEKDLHERGWK